MIETEILFTSADSALRFAFSYSTQQYSPTPMARAMRGGNVGTGKGLVGVDGAGQAGMVRCELKDFSDLHLALLVAQFAPSELPCDCTRACCSGNRPNVEWADAISYLTDHTTHLFAGALSHYRLRRTLIERHFGAHRDTHGKKLTLERLAEQCEIHRQTVSTHHQKLMTYLRGTKGVNGTVGVQAIALQRADELLRERGFVGMEEAA
ncbi:DNA-binding protein [Cupriavidus sp. RAF12]|uniref:DNA-binding protein n=1 Tax=Cupriavidus sp. RAF12 TaxID=3233050 RepID=UPI003F903D38